MPKLMSATCMAGARATAAAVVAPMKPPSQSESGGRRIDLCVNQQSGDRADRIERWETTTKSTGGSETRTAKPRTIMAMHGPLTRPMA